MDQLLTIKEACEILRMTDETLYKEIRDGKITAIKVKRYWLFKMEAIEDYLESRTVKARRQKQATFPANQQKI